MRRAISLIVSRLAASRARDLGILLVLSVIIGVGAGLGAIAFYWLLDGAQALFLGALAGYHPAGPGGETPLFTAADVPLRRSVLAILPALGGLASGLIVFNLAPEAAGHGTDAAIQAYHHRRGEIRARVPIVKAITSAITIGTGGSAGREGPIAQIGAGIASNIAAWLGLARRERAILMAAGLAAGIGAIFHAPLAGAIFGAEVMYSELDIEHEVLWPAFMASIVAYSVFAVKFGWSTLFRTPDFVFHDPWQLLPYSVLAVVVGLAAFVHVRVFYGVRDLFVRLAVPRALKPMIGGLVVGAVGWFLPDTLATGYGLLQTALELDASAPALGIGFLLVLAAGRMVTTAFSIGSGGSGGVFGPSVVIGGTLGGAVGLVAADLMPGVGIQPGAFVMVGMAGFFAAAGHVPLSTMIMVAEMTGNYHLLVPSMLVCIVAFLVVGRRSLFEHQLPSRLDAPSKRGHMMSFVLRRMVVSDAMALRKHEPAPSVRGTTSLAELLDQVADGGHECFPVVDDEGRLTGVVDGRTIRFALREQDAGNVVLAFDLQTPAVTLALDESLYSAIRKMRAANREELVVVHARDVEQVAGTLSMADILAAYDREMSVHSR
jgi:CIC family chloride channel protein